MRIPLLTSAVVLVAASPAMAAFPGQNGLIAFETNRDGNSNIYVAQPDGGRQFNATSGAVGHDRDASVAADGRSLAFASDREGTWDLFVASAAGTLVRVTSDNAAAERQPSFSPDGRRLAFESNVGNNYEVEVIGVDGSGRVNLTNNTAADGEPAWSPDGTRIAFASGRDGNAEIYVMNADGSSVRRLTNDPGFDSQPNWSPDGTRVTFTHVPVNGSAQVAIVNVDGTGAQILAGAPFISEAPAFSPDGTRIIFGSDRHGGFGLDLYTMNPDGSDVRELVDVPSGSDTAPDWAPAAAAPPPTNGGGTTPPPPVTATPITTTPAAPKASGVAYRGGKLRFTLDRAAPVKVTIERRRGRTFKRLRSFTQRGKAGKNAVKLGLKKRGRYRVTLDVGGAQKRVTVKVR